MADPSTPNPAAHDPVRDGLSRRALLQSAGGVAALSAGGCATTSTDPNPPPAEIGAGRPVADARRVTLRVNGSTHELTLEPRVTLLDALREVIGLTGSKKGCDRGQCGACTVLADGRRINACLTLAVMQEGVSITTIEGLGTPEALHPMQAAFVKNDAFQCGYCTPGQICSAVAMINEHRTGTASAVTADVRRSPTQLDDAEIRERMSGNLCRCGAYPNIVAAVRSVAGSPSASARDGSIRVSSVSIRRSAMLNVDYQRARSIPEALTMVQQPGAVFIAGGTNLLDLMKGGVSHARSLIDVSRLAIAGITPQPNGSLTIGAMVRNSDLANDRQVRERYPLLSQALLSGASPQLRNMATIGGNLLQRTRCPYFYDTAFTACNKRRPGSGCAAIDGFNRNHAIVGASDQCVATNPSDMNVALAALRAVVVVQGPQAERRIPMADFHRLPGSTPQLDSNLQAGELITAVELPASPFAQRSHYLKVRDRASYAFALVSVAAGLEMRDGVVSDAALTLGGIAHKPWRSSEAERALIGRPLTEAAALAAADIALQGAKPLKDNAFKLPLARRSIARALQTAGAAA